MPSRHAGSHAAYALLIGLATAGCQPAEQAQAAETPRPEPAQTAEDATENAGGGGDIPDVDIAFTRFTLDNGLDVVVHEDHKAPIVSVNIWYHVGSKDEGPAQTGFAHLFEHLMFQGSENWDGEYFEPFERAGATSMNGTTNTDRTNYFANVPVPALDMALWMESDRMGHFLGAVDQARLDEQRGVVINEKKQRASQPYGEVWEKLPPNTYPDGHPYSWSTIGSIEDLNAASLEDVKAWFKRYYGPSNATLVIAGDIDPDAVREKVERYFGSIPAGPPLEHQKDWVAPMTGEHRHVMQDRVPQARIYKTWNVPADGTPDETRLQIAANLLAGSKTSRLYKRLVYDEQIATDVSADLWSKEIGSQFIISATARPGVDLAEVEAALDEELERFIDEGVGAEELDRSRTSLAASFLRGAERIGGFGGKADILARGAVYHDDPGHFRKYLDTLRTVQPDALQATAERWLSDGVYVLSVLPFGDHSQTDSDVDRSQLPDIGDAPNLTLPDLQHAELDNGLKVWLAERDAAPVVQMRMMLDAGYAADPRGAPGTASLALGMLDEGTETRDGLEISAELDRLGASLSTSSSLDASSISMSAISSKLDASMDLYADVIRRPSFPEDQFQRLSKQRLAGIAQEKSNPTSLALRTIGPLLYGDEHAYGVPLTGSGTTDAIQDLTVADMRAFHRRWVRPDNATLIVVGDTDMATLKPLLEKAFGDWEAGDDAPPLKNLPDRPMSEQQRIYLIDKPGSSQATVIAGSLAPPKSHPQDIAMSTVNAILGGMFNSRINLNLREEKNWSYGARSLLMDARAQQPFFTYASVQIDKTAPAMKEMRSEITGILGDEPPTDEELTSAQANLTRTLPGDNETSSELAGTFANLAVFGLPEDYYETYVTRVQALDIPALNEAATTLLSPDHLTWVIVGDLDKVEQPIRDLDWAEVEVLPVDDVAAP